MSFPSAVFGEKSPQGTSGASICAFWQLGLVVAREANDGCSRLVRWPNTFFWNDFFLEKISNGKTLEMFFLGWSHWGDEDELEDMATDGDDLALRELAWRNAQVETPWQASNWNLKGPQIPSMSPQFCLGVMRLDALSILITPRYN